MLLRSQPESMMAFILLTDAPNMLQEAVKIAGISQNGENNRRSVLLRSLPESMIAFILLTNAPNTLHEAFKIAKISRSKPFWLTCWNLDDQSFTKNS